MANTETQIQTEQAMLREEMEHIRGLRGDDAGFIGICLSGGGIRSATFNLGILQSLAHQDMLQPIDYMSTVSGGGYIGAWLSALIYRSPDGLAGAQEVLHPKQRTGEEAPPLRFLRRYSNYLTPKVGLSGDTLAAIATYLRNFGLNLIPLVALGAAFIFVMYLLAQAASMLDARAAGLSLLWPALVLLVLAVWSAAAGLATTSSHVLQAWAAQPAWAWMVLVPAGVAGILVALTMMRGELADLERTTWVLACVVAYGIAWAGGYLIWMWRSNKTGAGISRRIDKVMLIPMTLLTGAVAGWLLSIANRVVRSLPGSATGSLEQAWWTMALGSPLVILCFASVIALHIGLLRRILSHEAREWWSRLGGLFLAAATVWAIAFMLAGLAPTLAIRAQGWIVQAGGIWAVLTTIGVWLAKSPLSGGEKSQRWVDIAVRATPYLFLTGFATGLSALVYFIFANHYCDACVPVHALAPTAVTTACPLCTETKNLARDFLSIARDVFANMANFDRQDLLLALAGCLGVFLLAGWRIDINLFSLHNFYRNRLTRAYLGASNYPDRRSHPFTGFSPDDDLRLCCLSQQRPFHIFNTALNLSGGDELAWQTRRSASFTFTPLHCGFEYRATRTTDGVEQDSMPLGGYRPTAHYQSRWGAYMGSAMSISGAAASPLSGYHTSPALAALMTIFNVRLGQWMGNPADPEAWEFSAPSFGGRYLLKELTATADAYAKFLYLSDGGHFENLGIYELVRRRCRLIVAVDAGCDPDYAFDDLANAIRKCSIDLGAEICINVDSIRPRNAFKHTAAHHAAGVISFADGSEGVLLYIKASLTGGEEPDILNYAANHKAFPHDTTADQCFDEDQFESYRKLGKHIGDELFYAIRNAAELEDGGFDADAFFAQVAKMATTPREKGDA
ncbi:MAG: patatin-like phospholipase family protein [Gallionellaceae bacterium]|nr:patatin-like phospholipase family protein [Gallionellaceae bacterium]